MRRVCVCERATLGQWRAVRRDYHRHTNGRVVHPPRRPGHAHHSVVTARVRLWYRTDGWLAGRVPTYPVDNGGGQTVVKCTNLCFRQGELNVALVFICFMLWGRRFLLPHISFSRHQFVEKPNLLSFSSRDDDTTKFRRCTRWVCVCTRGGQGRFPVLHLCDGCSGKCTSTEGRVVRRVSIPLLRHGEGVAEEKASVW